MTAFCFVEGSWDSINYNMNEDLNSFNWWVLNNKLVLNTEKNMCINFSLRKNIQMQQYCFKCTDCVWNSKTCINRSKINQTSNTKNLGIILDSELNWKTHIEKLKSKVITNVRLFYILKDKCCPLTVLRSLYFAGLIVG